MRSYWFIALQLAIVSSYAFGGQLSAVGSTTVEVSAIRDPAWMSYKNAIRTFEQFKTYSGPKDKIRPEFWLLPISRDPGPGPLQLSLIGTTVSRKVEVTPEGIVHLPYDQTALDEDADLRLNRKAGTYKFSFWATLQLASDGNYSESYLREACEQTLAFVRSVNLRFRLKNLGKRCVGVSIVFDGVAPVTPVVNREGSQHFLTKEVSDDASVQQFTYRFGDASTVIKTDLTPTRIVGLLE